MQPTPRAPTVETLTPPKRSVLLFYWVISIESISKDLHRYYKLQLYKTGKMVYILIKQYMNTIYKKIDLLNQEAFQYIYRDLNRTDRLCREAGKLAREEQYTKGIAWVLINSGLIEIEKGNPDRALDQLKQGRRLFLQIKKDIRGIICSGNSLALCFIRLGKMKKAFFYLQASLEQCKMHEFKELEFTAYNYLGILQFKTEHYSQALRFFEKAYTLMPRSNRTSILNNLGCTYRSLNNIDVALEYLNKALASSVLEKRKEAHIAILEEIGLTYGQLGDFRKGVQNLQSALDDCAPDNRLKLSIYINLGDFLLKLKDYSSAEAVLQKAEEQINESKSIEHRKLYLLLSELYERNNNLHKAIEHFKTYHNLSNELKSSELDEKVWLLETQSLMEMNRRVSAISEMGKKLTAFLERKEILNTLVRSLSSLFSIDLCIIGEQAEEGDQLEARMYNLVNGEDIPVKIDSGDPGNIMIWVIQHQTGLMLNNIPKEYSAYVQSLNLSFLPFPVFSVLCLPYVYEQSRGVIAIYCREKNAFNDEDWYFMEMLTSYARIALNNSRQTETIKAYNKKLLKLNRFDNLTGIFNRRHLLKMLEQGRNWCCRNNSCLYVMLIDVDDFKSVNDTWGHETGDMCLKEIGLVFKALLKRTLDGYGRYGGEEFLVFLQGMSHEEARLMAEKIRQEIEEKEIPFENGYIHISVSIGLYGIIPPKDCDLGTIIREADNNMYRSKEAGKNRVTSTIKE